MAGGSSVTSREIFLAGELELVAVQVSGGGAPGKVTNVGAASRQRAAATVALTLKSYGSCFAPLSATFTEDIHNEGGDIL